MEIHMRNPGGFTLIEILIAIAIIGILAAIAVPAYQTYVIKSEVGSALQFVGSLREKIEEFHEEQGRLPCSAYSGSGTNEAGISTGAVDKITQVRWLVHNPVHSSPTSCTGGGAHNPRDFHHGYLDVSMDLGFGKYTTAFEFQAHQRGDGGLVWKCVHTMSADGHHISPNVPAKYLPSECG